MFDYGSDKAEKVLALMRMLLEELDSFIVVYDFKNGEVTIDPSKEKYVKVTWDTEALRRFEFEGIIFRPDIPLLKQFLDFSNVGPENRKRMIRLRAFTEVHSYSWFRLIRICFFDENKEKDKVVFLCTNIDEKTELAQNLNFMSKFDPLTHLRNINDFTDRANRLIQENPDKSYALIRFDIAHFHSINALFGSKEGDNLLRYIAVRIREYLEEEDLVAYCRVTSDIFAVLIPEERYTVQDTIEYLQSAVFFYPQDYEVTLVFGVCKVTDQDREQEIPANILLDRAAAAHSSAKEDCLNSVEFYDERIRQEESNELMVTAQMHNALREEQFQVYFQPKVEMDTGRIIGAEALIRWIHPEKGVISPGQFIPIFEKNGFIIDLDEYVFTCTCRIIRKWLDEGRTVLPVSVNLARANLYNTRLLRQIDSCVEKYQIPPEYIEFELTESGFVTDNQNLAKLLQDLRERNYCTLMDDFGSGYSSLNALRELPVDILKIDMKFLPAHRDNTRANFILKYVVEMARVLGMKVIVEGVETAEQAELLLGINCRLAQGFYYYRPMPLERYEEALDSPPRSLKQRKRDETVN